MSKDFHLAEYSALRGEMIELIREIGLLNRFFLVSVAVSVAWLLSESGKLDRVTSFIGAWLPYFVAQWFSAYRRGLSSAINRLDEYLLKLEQTYASPELGWQKLISQQRKSGIYPFARAKVVYQLVTLGTLLFAFYYAVRFSLNLHVGTLFWIPALSMMRAGDISHARLCAQLLVMHRRINLDARPLACLIGVLRPRGDLAGRLAAT